MGRPTTRWEDPNQVVCREHTAVFTSWQNLSEDTNPQDAMETHSIH